MTIADDRQGVPSADEPYEAPKVETVVTAEEVERECQHAVITVM